MKINKIVWPNPKGNNQRRSEKFPSIFRYGIHCRHHSAHFGKSFQLVRYYGWYSNRGRGEREKCYQAAAANSTDSPATVEVLDVSDYKPKKVVCIRSCRRLTPSPQWRECIKKVWEVDTLSCAKCGSEMRIISFITEAEVIRKILEHLNLWDEEQRIRPPPSKPHSYPNRAYEPFDDGWPGYEEPYITVQ